MDWPSWLNAFWDQNAPALASQPGAGALLFETHVYTHRKFTNLFELERLAMPQLARLRRFEKVTGLRTFVGEWATSNVGAPLQYDAVARWWYRTFGGSDGSGGDGSSEADGDGGSDGGSDGSSDGSSDGGSDGGSAAKQAPSLGLVAWNYDGPGGWGCLVPNWEQPRRFWEGINAGNYGELPGDRRLPSPADADGTTTTERGHLSGTAMVEGTHGHFTLVAFDFDFTSVRRTVEVLAWHD
jgi:hypothetical protein